MGAALQSLAINVLHFDGIRSVTKRIAALQGGQACDPDLRSTQTVNHAQDAIPKIRPGSFSPSILEPMLRIDQTLYVVIMEAKGLSRSEVSRRRSCHHVALPSFTSMALTGR